MKKSFNFLLVLYPILCGYGLSPQADFGLILLLLVGVFCCIKKLPGFTFRFPVGYSVFFVVALLLSILFAQTIPLRLILYSVNLCMACYLVSFEALKKYYGWLVFVTCSFFLLQLIIAFVTGIHVSGILPYIPTIYDGKGVDMISFQEQDVRFSSLFLEPSYFVQYLFPYVVLALYLNNRYSFRNAIFVSLIMLLVGSGNGVILLLIIWGFWFLFGKIKFHIKIATLVIGLLVMGIIWSIDNSFFLGLLDRSAEFQSYRGNETYQSSGFIRIFRGYFAYNDMPLFNKIFGASPQFADEIFRSNIWFVASNDVMINGTQTLLIYHGFISCFLFFRHLFLMFVKYQHKAMFVMMLCCVWLMLTESYYLCARMFLTIMLMYGIMVYDYYSLKCVGHLYSGKNKSL